MIKATVKQFKETTFGIIVEEYIFENIYRIFRDKFLENDNDYKTSEETTITLVYKNCGKDERATYFTQNLQIELEEV